MTLKLNKVKNNKDAREKRLCLLLKDKKRREGDDQLTNHDTGGTIKIIIRLPPAPRLDRGRPLQCGILPPQCFQNSHTIH